MVPDGEETRPADVPARPRALAGKTVLVVDDDPRNLFSLGALLQRRGLRVLRAQSGPAALELLRSERGIDLVLLDLFMPGMDGYEVLTALRHLPVLAGTPIVAFTADALKGTREACMEAGFDDYLAKPVQPHELMDHLERWIG